MNSAARPRPGWQSFSSTGDEEASFLAAGADLPGANTHSGGGVIAMRDAPLSVLSRGSRMEQTLYTWGHKLTSRLQRPRSARCEGSCGPSTRGPCRHCARSVAGIHRHCLYLAERDGGGMTAPPCFSSCRLGPSPARTYPPAGRAGRGAYISSYALSAIEPCVKHATVVANRCHLCSGQEAPTPGPVRWRRSLKRCPAARRLATLTAPPCPFGSRGQT